MRIVVGLLVAIAGLTSTATAGTTAELKETTSAPAVAVAVNAPIMWLGAKSIGVSGYLAVHRHHSLRINYASYDNLDPINTLGGGDGGALRHSTDIGVSWQVFPGRVWDGFLLELGGLRRTQDMHDYSYNDDPRVFVGETTSGYAARGMVGWSVLGWNKVFIAAAVGASYGHYTGTETVTVGEQDAMTVTNKVDRSEIAAEAYLRFGIAFGL